MRMSANSTLDEPYKGIFGVRVSTVVCATHGLDFLSANALNLSLLTLKKGFSWILVSKNLFSEKRLILIFKKNQIKECMKMI